ncbi:MAG: OmpA family protein, partial [Desulfobacterales bacterium]
LALGSGQKYLTKIPFDTGSTAPHEASMDELMLRLVFYGILSSDRYHINFIGHASRVGDDGSNQTLSELRAMAVKDRLEILLESMSEDVSFMFDDDKIDVEGQGEEEAKKADKPDDDDSSSDRVVEVIFEVK